MPAVTVAVLVGFVCCALVIRVLGTREQTRRAQAVVVGSDRARRSNATRPGRVDA